MEQSQSSSVLFKFSFLVFFILMTLGSFIWFLLNLLSLLDQINSASASIVFDKGGFYMLGVSVVLGALLFNMIYEGILKKNLTRKIAKIVSYSAFIGVAMAVIVPQIANYSTDKRMAQNGYEVCDKASYQWLHYKRIVYTSTLDTCTRLARSR